MNRETGAPCVRVERRQDVGGRTKSGHDTFPPAPARLGAGTRKWWQDPVYLSAMRHAGGDGRGIRVQPWFLILYWNTGNGDVTP